MARTVRNFPFVMSVLATAPLMAQTPEQRLDECMKSAIERYQPTSSYREEFKCAVGNKKPFGSTPSKGPFAVDVNYQGYVILTADARETFKISNGGHTPPVISPRRDKATLTLWCAAEDKVYGKSGKYNVEVKGERKRVATGGEYRRVLTECTRRTDGDWS